MKNWLDIENIKEGDILMRGKGKLSQEVQIIHIEILENYAMFKWKFTKIKGPIFTNEFVKCNQQDGSVKWEDLTVKRWE